MGKCIFKDGSILYNYNKPYIVAEVNTSHNGKIENAKTMIQVAKNIGCNCIKFQSWSPESLYSKSYYQASKTSKRFIKKFTFNEKALSEIIQYCKEIDIAFSSTPYCEAEVDFLVKNEVPYIKIASMELNNLTFIKYIALTGFPIVLSTGMGEIEEIKEAVETIKKTGNTNIVLLHCVSIYPAKEEKINLNNIVGLREIFPDIPIGFSDHTIGDTISIGATALGAALIEKHFTLNKNKIGLDNQMAMEPTELAQLIKKCHIMNEALGFKERRLLTEEYEQRKNMRRSIVAKCDIVKGTILTANMLTVKRPGTGLPPKMLESLIGKRVLRTIEADTLILESDII